MSLKQRTEEHGLDRPAHGVDCCADHICGVCVLQDDVQCIGASEDSRGPHVETAAGST